MTGKIREEIYMFRIGNLPKCLFLRIKEILQREGIQYHVGKYWKNKNNFVISINLEEGLRIDILKMIIDENKIPDNKFGVYISLLTPKDLDGISVPKHVTRCYRSLGGMLDFSISCSAYDD